MDRAGRRLWANSGSGCFFIHIWRDVLLVPFPLPHQSTWGRDSRTQTHAPHCPHAARGLRVAHFSPSPDSPRLPHLQPTPAWASLIRLWPRPPLALPHISPLYNTQRIFLNLSASAAFA